MSEQRSFETDEVFHARCDSMRQRLSEVREVLISAGLADLCDIEPQEWSDRLYRPLEAMASRDLALMVVILLADEAEAEARRLWSGLHTLKPRDVTA